MNKPYAKAGFYEKNITPPVGIWLAGFGGRSKPSEGVADPLYLRIAALRDKLGGTFILVSADILTFPQDMSWRLKMWLAAKLNLDPSSLLLNASHTHCGPYMGVGSVITPQWPLDSSYVFSFENDVKIGILRALENMEPARIEYGLSHDDFAVNRRLPDVYGNILWGANENGYSDNELPVVTVRDAHGHLTSVIYSYGCHPTSKGGYLISADYPGAVSRALKKSLGENVYTIFLQGAGGSSKPRFYDRTTKKFVQASIGQVEELGRGIGDKIVEFINSGKMKDIILHLSSREQTVKLPFDMAQMPSDAYLMKMVDEDCSYSGCHPQPLINRLWAATIIERKRTGCLPFCYDMLVNSTVLANGLTMIGCSGELTAEAGRVIKKAFTGGDLILLGYCFYTQAYIPDDEMLPQGGYEELLSGRYNMFSAPFALGINNILKKEIAQRKR